jgi:hypothetical protein
MGLMKKSALAIAASAAVLGAGMAGAEVSSGKAAALGNSLTPMGSEKAGNAAGTIPEWTGGIRSAPSGYRAGRDHIDPFAGDKVLFQITPANYKQYADKLGAGQQAMFAKYKDYRMDVYPTRRSASFPQRTYEFTKRNATKCKLIANGEGIQNCAEGFPFPIPNNAYEAIWNHKLKYKGLSVRSFSNQAAPTASGAFTLVRLQEEILGLYYKPGNTSENINNNLLYFKQDVMAPPRLAGGVLLVHETLNAKAQPRQAWVYNPGQRRVRRAPNVAYDNPGTASDGLRTNDMTDMFNGALDKYNWNMIGKKEMYVPYNSYKAHSDKTLVKDLIQPNFINPDLLRYELHRVWIVEADLKPGQRHINPKRTFYLDEDSWQILEIDHYDSQGKLWRYSEAPSVNYYEVPVFWSTLEIAYDLKAGRYLVQGLDNQEPEYNFSYPATPDMFSPQALRTRGIQ